MEDTLKYPDRELVEGKWKLQMFYTAKGQQNEGIDGVLLFEGKKIEPKRVGEVIDTDLGEMKYYLRPEDRKMPYEYTGWNFADTNKIIMSWEEEPE